MAPADDNSIPTGRIRRTRGSRTLEEERPIRQGASPDQLSEDEVLEFLRRLDIPPGDYAAPHAGSPAAMKEPAFLEKMKGHGNLTLRDHVHRLHHECELLQAAYKLHDAGRHAVYADSDSE